jgi:hypothetical protein
MPWEIEESQQPATYDQGADPSATDAEGTDAGEGTASTSDTADTSSSTDEQDAKTYLLAADGTYATFRTISSGSSAQVGHVTIGDDGTLKFEALEGGDNG